MEYQEYKDLREYVGIPMIAWLSYNKNYETTFSTANTVCYVTPQFKKENDTWEIISSNDFPESGAIAAHLAGRKEAADFINETGNLAIVRINDDHSKQNAHLFPDTAKKTNYHMSYSSTIPNARSNSQIWIESFTETRNFYQIIELNSSFDENKKTKQIDIPPELVIYTHEIFIKSGTFYYGPFCYDKQDDQTLILDSNKEEYNNFINKYSALDISDAKLDILNETRNIAVSLIDKKMFQPIINKCIEKIDWLSDNELIDSLIDTIKTYGTYSKDKLDEINEILKSEFDLTDERKKRLNDLHDQAVTKYDFIQNFSQLIIENKELLTEFRHHIPEEDIRLMDGSLQQKQLEEELKTLRDEFEGYKSTHPENSIAVPEHYKELQQQLEKQQQIIKEYEQSVHDKNALQKDIENLKTSKQDIEKEYENLVLMKRKIQDAIKESVKNLKDEASIIARSIDSNLMDNVLRLVSGSDWKENQTSQMTAPETLKTCTPDELIDNIATMLSDSGRSVPKNDIVNYLTCISQGFITTFAGEPGTGKTSLCNLLAKSLGLNRNSNYNRFIPVSVERGWTSIKDFIGYYNPLTKTMEKSNIDVYNAVESLDQENGQENAPMWILLDEANLSPIEHYWANFLKFCDADSLAAKSINLGGNKSYNIPDHLRFLATVNFDHTTEELSPRFLDRSWIITLRGTDNIELTGNIPTDTEFTVSAASFDAFRRLADTGTTYRDAKSANEAKWQKIQNVFKECKMPIMPRNQKMVQNYIAVASRYMDMSMSKQYAPVDYAVAQKILPLINGSGDNYKKLLEKLQAESVMLPLCKEHLERIVSSAAQNMGFFQFFAR